MDETWENRNTGSQWIDCAADLARFERIPYAQAVPVSTIPHLLELNARLFGLDDALMYLQSLEKNTILRLSHSDLFDQVVRAGTLLRQCGVERNDPVAVIAPHAICARCNVGARK